jgi:hypothetical protein
LKAVVLYNVRRPLVLALVHRSVHARFEERTGGLVRLRRFELEDLIDVTLQVPPDKSWGTITTTGSELEGLVDKEGAFMVSYRLVCETKSWPA